LIGGKNHPTFPRVSTLEGLSSIGVYPFHRLTLKPLSRIENSLTVPFATSSGWNFHNVEALSYLIPRAATLPH
jgi:hypothetical protein